MELQLLLHGWKSALEPWSSQIVGEKGKEQQKTRVSFLERVPNKSPTAVPFSVKPALTSAADDDVRLIPSPDPTEGNKSGDAAAAAAAAAAERTTSPPTPPPTSSSSQALSASAIKDLLSAALSGGGAGGAAAAEMLLARQLQQQQQVAPAAAGSAGQGRKLDPMHL